jgi:bifunctional ADP-heptose synthase (sugar kinase/adenylyltransferase)
LELANALEFVDLVVCQQDYTPYANVVNIAPNILMESGSHDELQINEGRTIMNDLGGRVIVMPYFQSQYFTSTKIKISITS